MSSSKQDDWQSVEENMDPARRRNIEGTARLVSRYGMWIEKNFMDADLDYEVYSFLRSSDHPHHAFYQNKIAEYRIALKKQKIQPPDANDDDDAQPPSLQIKCPEGMTRKEFGVIKLTAQFVVRYGKYFWPDLINSLTINPNPQFEFIKTRDSRFSFFLGLVDAYANLLKPYRNLPSNHPNRASKESFLEGFFNLLQGQKHEEEEGVEMEMPMVDFHAFTFSLDYFANSDRRKLEPPPGHISAQMLSAGMLDAPPTHDAQPDRNPIFWDNRPPSPRDYPFRYPEGITRKQLCIIKLTAQFMVRYGYTFWMGLMKRLMGDPYPHPHFEFIKSDDRYSFFYRLVAAYSKVLMPYNACKEADVLNGFFKLLRGEKQEEGMRYLHAFVGGLDYFANREDQELTPHGCFSVNPPTLMQSGIPDPIPRESPFGHPQFPRPSVPPPSPPPPLPQHRRWSSQ